MMRNKIFKPLLMSAAVIVSKEDKKGMASESCVCRRTELPIYSNSNATGSAANIQDHCPPDTNFIEETVRKIRTQLVSSYQQFDELRYKGEAVVNSGMNRADEIIQYLQKEDNTLPRYGAIAIGGLTGLILSIRRGIIKKSLYTLLGSGAVAAVCYPKEARQYSQQAITEARKYATIAYNFAYGVKKGEPIHELPSLPKFPTSFSEALDMASSIGKSSSTNVSPVVGDAKEQEVAK